MKIAVLSGKGGTGKTFVSVNLAAVLDQAVYIDCDVEEPNGQLFFKPEINKKTEIKVLVPSFSEDKCTGCKKCVDFCGFHALAFVGNKPMLFPEICHSCGGCKLVCPNGAVTENPELVGMVQSGQSGNVQFLSGCMEVGQASGVPIIRELLEQTKDTKLDVVTDCPPGSGCLVMESIHDADYCIMIAEPTRFGCENMKMIHELLQVFNKKFGVVLNKCTDDTNPSEEFCKEAGIDIIGKIPYDSCIAERNASGLIVSKMDAEHREMFTSIVSCIREKVKQ